MTQTISTPRRTALIGECRRRRELVFEGLLTWTMSMGSSHPYSRPLRPQESKILITWQSTIFSYWPCQYSGPSEHLNTLGLEDPKDQDSKVEVEGLLTCISSFLSVVTPYVCGSFSSLDYLRKFLVICLSRLCQRRSPDMYHFYTLDTRHGRPWRSA